MMQVRGAEKDPGDADAHERYRCPHQLFDARTVIVRPEPKNLSTSLHDQKETVQQAPNDEVPGSAVPESRKEHCDKQIAERLDRSMPISPEGNVHVVAKPSGQRNVPALPKIGETDCGIWKAKVP